MDGALNLVMTVDNQKAIAAMLKTENEIRKLGNQIRKTTDEKKLIELKAQFDALNSSMKQMQDAGQKVASGSNTAGNALTNLGRIAQDAPYGFIGIQNNLNPMLESFQRLKAESGSTGAALKQMAAGLIGPAGIGIALSVGSALLVAFGDKLFKTKEKVSEAAKAFQEFGDVQKEANKNAAKEIINSKILYEASQNVSIAMKDRLKAATELKDLYPQLLSKYSAEDIALGKANSAYKSLTDEIIKNARAKAYAAKISELEAKKLDAEVQIQKIINAGNKERARTTNDPFNPQGMAAINTGKTAAEKNAEITARGTRAIKEQVKIINDATSQQNIYKNAIGETNLQQETVNDLKDETSKKTKKQTDTLAEYIKMLQYGRTVQQQGMREVDPRTKLAGDYSSPDISIPKGMEERTIAVQNATKTQLDYANSVKLSNMQEAEAYQIATMATSAFTDLGNALLMGQDLGTALGNVFRKLAIDIGAAALKAFIFNKILAVLSGGASEIGFNAGAILGSAIGGRAIGGVTQGPKSGYPMMLHGTEAVLTPHQMTGIINQSMNAGAMQGMSMNNDMGGGAFVLRGNDLVLALQRSNYALNLRRG